MRPSPTTLPLAAPPLAGLNYRRCGVEELRQFIQRRSGTAPERVMNKKALIDSLERLDEHWQFPRFTNLPPELRNMVYQELLRIDPDTGRRANANILRANSQLYLETITVLYGINTFDILMTCRAEEFQSHHWVQTDIQFQGKKIPDFATPLTNPRMGHVALEYAKLPKAAFLRIQRLRLEVKMDFWIGIFNFDVEDRRFVDLSRALLALANAFGQSRALKKVEIHFKTFRRQHQRTRRPLNLDDILYPLAKLKQTEDGTTQREVTLQGFPPYIERALKQRMSLGTPRPLDAFSILDSVRVGFEKVKRRMEQALLVEPTFDVFESAFKTVVTECEIPAVIDHEVDKWFCGKVMSLQKFLEMHEEQWVRWPYKAMIRVMRDAQKGIEGQAAKEASAWSSGQEAVFEKLMRR